MGRERLYRLQRAYTFRWLSSAVLPTARCEVPDACQAIRSDLQTMSMDLIPRVRTLEHWAPSLIYRLCAKCIHAAQAELRCDRASVWDLLPDVFGLTDWANVQTDQNIRVSYFSLIAQFDNIGLGRKQPGPLCL